MLGRALLLVLLVGTLLGLGCAWLSSCLAFVFGYNGGMFFLADLGLYAFSLQVALSALSS